MRPSERLHTALRGAVPETVGVWANIIPKYAAKKKASAVVYRLRYREVVNFAGDTEASFRVMCHAKEYSDSAVLADAVEAALAKQSAFVIANGDSDYDEKLELHIQELTVTVR